VVINLRK